MRPPSFEFRAPSKTVMPARPSCLVISNPMPLFAPVIKATFRALSLELLMLVPFKFFVKMSLSLRFPVLRVPC